MIKTHSDDPDIEAAAAEALTVIDEVLSSLTPATTFDYGGHELHLDDYGLCLQCTKPIAEAQQAHNKLVERAEATTDPTVKEHVALVAELFRLEAAAAQIRAELHNGQGSEKILNRALGFIYDHNITDSYEHSHNKGK